MLNWILSLGAFVVGLSLSSVSWANPFLLTPPKSESIQTSREIFADLSVKDRLGQGLSADQSDTLALWVQSYRQDPTTTSAESLANGPYIDLLLSSKTTEIYTAAYSSSYSTLYQKTVENTPLELLFDAFIDSVLDGTAAQNPTTRATAKKMGGCLAAKVKAGKADSCVLDTDETHTRAPSFFKQAGAKLTCFLTLPTPCWARNIVFNAAKAQLIEARKSPSVQETVAKQFKREFPGQFKTGFFDLIEKIRADLGKFFGGKTLSADHVFWTAKTPLVEQDDRVTHAMTMKQFATSIDSDVLAAAHFSKSPNPAVKSAAAPLLYAAANKLLVLTGGVKAHFDLKKKKFDLGVDTATRSEQSGLPSTIPSFTPENFGGIGAIFSGAQSLLAPWDWSNYDPAQSWEIFPAQFVLNGKGEALLPSGVTASESIEDLAILLKASVDFFALTAPGAPLGKYFSADIAQITDQTSPVIFPTDGRSVAVGAIGAVLQNATDPAHGHLALVDKSSTGGAIQIIFYDQVGAAGRAGNPVPVASVAKLMEAAVDTREGLMADPLVPVKLAAKLPLLNDAIQLGTFSMLSHGQGADGGFYEFLDLPQSPRTLKTQVAGLSLLLKYYDVSGIRLLRINIESAFQFLNRYFQDASLNPSVDTGTTAELWALMRVWDQMQYTLSLTDEAHSSDGWNFNYPLWNARFTALSAKLAQGFANSTQAASGPSNSSDLLDEE